MAFKFLLALLLSSTALAENLRTQDFQQSLNSRTSRNYARNSGAEKNLIGVTASGGSLTRSTTTPIKGAAHFAIDASSSGQTYTWAADDFQPELQGMNCVATFKVKGDASLYKAYASLAGVKKSSEIQLSDTGSVVNSVRVMFPCGATSADDPTFTIEATSASAAAISVDNVYIGEFDGTTSIAQPEQMLMAGGTPTGGLGGLTNTVWGTVTRNLYGAYNSSTGAFTAHKAGSFCYNAGVSIGGTEALDNYITLNPRLNTVLSRGGGLTRAPGTVSNLTTTANFCIDMVVGDVLDFRTDTNIGSPGFVSALSNGIQITYYPPIVDVVSIGAPGAAWTDFTTSYTYDSGGATNFTSNSRYLCTSPVSISLEYLMTFTGTSASYTQPRASLPSGATFSPIVASGSARQGTLRGVSGGGTVFAGLVSVASSDNKVVPQLYYHANASTDNYTQTIGVTNTQIGTSGGLIQFSVPDLTIQPGFCPASPAAYIKQGVVYDNAVRAEGITGVTTVAAGRYTPTLTNTTNVSASTAQSCLYNRLGAIVSVACPVTLTCTMGSNVTPVATVLKLTLPVASAGLSSVNDITGQLGSDAAVVGESGRVTADTTNKIAQVNFPCKDTTGSVVRYIDFKYEVK